MEFQFMCFRPLYDDMRRVNKPHEKFEFCIKETYFEVIFLMDRTPFELLIGVRGHPLAFILEVKSGFKTELPDRIYYQICEILNLSYSEDHFSSAKFLREIDSHAPQRCSPIRVQPHEIARYKPNIPDNEKIYFLGWNDHLIDGKRAQNFEKTRAILGDAVADFCIKNNISSLWTHIPRKTRNYSDPPGFSM